MLFLLLKYLGMIKKILFTFFLLTFVISFAYNNKRNIETENDSLTALNFHYNFTTDNKKSVINEFNTEFLNKNYSFDSIPNILRDKANEIFDKIDSLQNYVSSVNPLDSIVFPVGIKKNINNVSYIVGFSNAKFYPQYTELTVFVKITLPQNDIQGNQAQLFFGADHVKISKKGGIFGDVNIVLLGDVAISINGGKEILVLKGGFNMQTGQIQNKTFATINCNGFKSMGLQADIIFSREVLEPVDNNYNLITDTNQKVKGTFNTTITDWNDILVNISLPLFQITKQDSTDGTGKGGLVFNLTNATFDFSDTRNDPSVDFSSLNYEQFLVQGNPELWRGVYVNNLQIILPKEFKKKNSSQRVIFTAQNMLIDDAGISGNFNVDNLLSLAEGSASKWQFSVDHFEVSLLRNQLTEGAFNGKIVLPITKELNQQEINDSTLVKERTLKYDALLDINNENYTLTLQPLDTLNFNVFKAKAHIYSNSYVQLEIENHKFKPSALLNGDMVISSGIGNSSNNNKKTVNFKGVEFQNLHLQTESPKLQIDYLGYSGEVKIANFPVTLSDINASVVNDTAKLHFAVDINLMSSNGFSGHTALDIVAKDQEINGLQKWKYDHIDIDDISLNVNLGAVKFNGLIQVLEDDPVYGDGYYGNVSATFNDIGVNATARFGKTTFRYWYVDAFADLSGAPVRLGGVLKVKGLGGGASYHMHRGSGGNSNTLSGSNYIPNDTNGLGFRALMKVTADSPNALNGKLGFEMDFNNSGGINSIYFYGDAHIIKKDTLSFGNSFITKLRNMDNKINNLSPAQQNNASTNPLAFSKLINDSGDLSFSMGIDANFGMLFDFQNHSFHANLETFINSKPLNFIKGTQDSNGKAGEAVLHIDPNDWYLTVGTPNSRIGVGVGIGSLRVNANAYFMMGTNIPSSPPPPQEVANILGISQGNLDYMRDLNELGLGRGFAFGMSVDVDTGEMTFLIFYAHFSAGVGFDIMLKDYENTTCAGSGQIGVDGWYANGQAYAYLQGELGVNVNLMFIHKKVAIISGSAAVLLQAQLPNPSWFKGYVGGDYNLLGGLVKGHYNFKLELGEQCEVINGSPLAGIKVISTIRPDDQATNIDVFKIPQVAFNVNIDEPFEFRDDSGLHTYRIKLDEFSLKHNNNPIAGNIEWNTDKNLANFVANETLPPNSPIDVVVKVSFQKRRGNGTWETMQQNGHTAQEIKQIQFTTGDAPDYIPVTNIKYCYPVIDQKYFYKDESNTGYVKLKMGQSYLFPPKTDWTQHIDLIDDTGIVRQAQNVSYDSIAKKLVFNLPPMDNQKHYHLKIISTSPQNTNDTTQTDDNYQTQDLGEGNLLETRDRQANDVSKGAEDVEILDIPFSTSEYNTFADKITAKQNASSHGFVWTDNNLEHLFASFNNTEPFDEVELIGNTYTDSKALIKYEAVLDNYYYQNIIYPIIYEGYPLENIFTVDRDTTIYGLPPVRAMTQYISYFDALQNNPNANVLYTYMPYGYGLMPVYYDDLVAIRNKIVGHYNGTSGLTRYDNIINYNFNNVFSPGQYKVRYKYYKPGGEQGTSQIFEYHRL